MIKKIILLCLVIFLSSCWSYYDVEKSNITPTSIQESDKIERIVYIEDKITGRNINLFRLANEIGVFKNLVYKPYRHIDPLTDHGLYISVELEEGKLGSGGMNEMMTVLSLSVIPLSKPKHYQIHFHVFDKGKTSKIYTYTQDAEHKLFLMQVSSVNDESLVKSVFLQFVKDLKKDIDTGFFK